MAVPAWTAYLPVPGLAFLPAYGDPTNRLARFHAWQGGIHVAAWWIGLVLIGALLRAAGADPSEPTAAAIVLGFVNFLYVVAGLAGCGIGIAAAHKGRYTRIRPAWDIAAVLRK